MCCLVLQSNCALLLTIQFASLFFFFFFFFAKILSGPYLWNRYPQRLQIECAAWSCSLILHCCLPSNSLRYFLFFFFLFFRQDFVRAISLEPLLAETPNWVCCLVLRSNFALLLTIQFALLFFFFFFSATILSGPYLWNRYSQRFQIECAAWSCGLILRCCLPSNSLRYFIYLFFFFFFFFRHDFVRAISLEPLLAETPNWVCCLVLWSNFALLLTIQFASLISSLINIISLLLTTFDWTKVRGIAPRSHTGRPRTYLVYIVIFKHINIYFICSKT